MSRRTHHTDVRSVDHPAMRDVGLAAGRRHADAGHMPSVAPPSAADTLPRSAGTGSRQVPPDLTAAHPRYGWLLVSFVLLVIGAVSCHNEADGSPFCAEDIPTCGVEVGS